MPILPNGESCIKSISRVILTEPVECDDGGTMVPGDIGVVIHIHPKEAAYVLEFVGVDGKTTAVASGLAHADPFRNASGRATRP